LRIIAWSDDVDPTRAAAALVTVRHLLGLPVDEADRSVLTGQAVES